MQKHARGADERRPGALRQRKADVVDQSAASDGDTQIGENDFHIGEPMRPAAPFSNPPAALEPRKNVPNFIRVWVRVFHDDSDAPALVLAGGKGWDEGVDPALAEVPDHMTVLRPGYLPLEDLPGFLSGCEILAYPSVAEGFGLPVLEAMACGAAVLTTRETSLPEVGGDAVAYCGLDAPAIARALVKLERLSERRAEADDRVSG